jgi:hypothetical protein
MTIRLSDRTMAILTASRPVVERVRDEIEAAMRRRLAGTGPRSDAIASALVDALLVAHGPVDRERLRDLRLGGEHYAIFGDALKPVLRDVLGAGATTDLIAAWGDAYWALATSVRSDAVAELV